MARHVHYTTDLVFTSRRSPVLAVNGAVASSQPEASRIGLDILRAGGNAVDACIAMAAALNVTEPCSTGLGGDCFVIVYDPQTKRVSGLNGSGRAPKALTLDTLPREALLQATSDVAGTSAAAKPQVARLDPLSIHCATVPGAAAGWCDANERWGKMKLAQILAPAIQLSERGFAVAPITAHSWQAAERLLGRHAHGRQLLMPNGHAPRAGDIFRNPDLANTFRLLCEKGKAGFYQGKVAQAIVSLCQSLGGLHAIEDLSAHVSSFPDPIKVNYRGVNVWEIPPSGQGLTALLALNILSKLQPSLDAHVPGSAEHLHLMIEAMRLAFADTRYYVADSDHVHVPVEDLLCDAYATKRAAMVRRQVASLNHKYGSPTNGTDTVSFCAVDADGMACSFINSNYMGFGTGYVPDGCGFTLQNRGHGFTLEKGHPNCIHGGKRPYHTIIPGMATYADTEELFGPFSCMGAFMQPQGHVQLLSFMIDHGLEPQRALDQPRFCIERGEAGGYVMIEEGISEDVLQKLQQLGHDVRRASSWERAVFGRGQIIRKSSQGVLWCGSDGRGDGCAIGY